MRRLHFAGAVTATVMLFAAVGLACGDKLLVVSRGVRFQHAYALHRGNLVIYSTGTRSDANLKIAGMQTALKKVGHKLQTVENIAQLDQLLKSEKVDVVLADFADLAGITDELQAAPSKPVVLPILFKPSKTALAAVQREYKFALRVPADEVQFLTVIDEAMKSRLRTGAKT